MLNGDVQEFIAQLHYQDHYVEYQGEKFFFNGCQCTLDENPKVIAATLEIYKLAVDYTATVIYSITKADPQACVKQFLQDQIMDGKTFYQIERELTWTD